MDIHESGEDYLEAILRLIRTKGYARSTDVAELVGVSKPSVSNATRILEERGYITFGDDHMLSLTESGQEVAERIYERHCQLTKILMALGVSESTAEEDACKMEHDISEETFEKLKTLIQDQGK